MIFPLGEVLDPEVVGLDVGDARAVGRELGEHEARLGLAGAELLELAASRRRGPSSRRACSCRQTFRVFVKIRSFAAVGGPGVLLGIERLFAPARGHEARGRHEDAPRAGRRVVADDVLAAAGRGRGLDGRVGLAAFEPLERAELLLLVGGLVVDPVELGGQRRPAPQRASAPGPAARAGRRGGREGRVRAGAGDASSDVPRRWGGSRPPVYISESRRK